MLRRIEGNNDGIITNGNMDNEHRGNMINGLQNIFNINAKWMPQLQAIAAATTDTPDALQPGTQRAVSYREVQDWSTGTGTIAAKRNVYPHVKIPARTPY